MKKLSLALFLAAATLILTGCRSDLTIDGRPCYGLDQDEVNILVATSRSILLDDNSTFVPSPDQATVRTQEPNVIITYVGDKTGTAKVVWDLPQRIVGVTYRGEFLTDEMRWFVTTTNKQDEVIFATENKLTPEQQKQMLRKPPRQPRQPAKQ